MRSGRVFALYLGLFAANAGAQSTTDYDDDNDNLIDIRTLAWLSAVRYDLDGNGVVALANATTSYFSAFFNPVSFRGRVSALLATPASRRCPGSPAKPPFTDRNYL